MGNSPVHVLLTLNNRNEDACDIEMSTETHKRYNNQVPEKTPLCPQQVQKQTHRNRKEHSNGQQLN